MSDKAVEQHPLETWAKGEEINHRKANQSIDAIRALQRGVNPPMQDRDIRPILRQFRVSTIGDEWIGCVELGYGNVVNTAVTYIAKPFLLRVITLSWTRDSITYTRVNAQRRTAVSGATSETQEITPKYVVNDTIYAARMIGGGVGGVFFGATPLLGGDNQPIIWLDMNCDGRFWAKIA